MVNLGFFLRYFVNRAPGLVASYDIWPGNREDLFWYGIGIVGFNVPLDTLYVIPETIIQVR